MAKGGGSAGRGGSASSGAVAGAPGGGGGNTGTTGGGGVESQVNRFIQNADNNGRVYLSDLRDKVTGDWGEVATVLRAAQLEGRIVLMPLDDPQEARNNPQRFRDSIRVAGDTRYFFYKT